MRVTWLRATKPPVAGEGVPYRFWLRVNRERSERRWSWDRVSEETARYTPDGKAIPRSTIANWRTSTRRPSLRLVYAVADALGIDRVEAREIAGHPPDAQASDAAVAPRLASAIQELMDADDISLEAKILLLGTMGRTEKFLASLRVQREPDQTPGERQAG